jgi:hypothetical protein
VIRKHTAGDYFKRMVTFRRIRLWNDADRINVLLHFLVHRGISMDEWEHHVRQMERLHRNQGGLP